MRKPAAHRGPGRPRHQTRERAKHLLVHRANGGIHNAAIALRLVTERLPSSGIAARDTASYVAAGVRGTANASRALQLLGALVGLDSASAAPDPRAFIDDIAKILHAESLQHGITVDLRMRDGASTLVAIPIESLAEMLVEGLSAVEGAVPNSTLRIQPRESTSGSEKHLRFDFEVAPRDAH